MLDLCVFKSEEDVNEQQTGIDCVTQRGDEEPSRSIELEIQYLKCVCVCFVRKLTELKTKHTQKLPQHRKEIFIVVFTELCRGDKFLCVHKCL